MSAISYSVGLDTNRFTGGISAMRSGIAGITGSMGRMVTALPVAGLIGGIGALTTAFYGLKKASNLAAEMESTAVSFRVLMGDAGKAKAMLDDVAALGERTPFQFPELADATRKLLAFGVAGEKIIPILTNIGDVSSGIQAPIGEIAEIFGKAKTQGTLFAEDINQLVGRGIPVIAEFAKILGKPESEIKKMASEGAITFPLLEQAFLNLTAKGGMFHGMMAEQAQTTAGMISTMKDAWEKLLRTIGAPVNDWLKPQIAGWTEILEKAGVRLSGFINLLREAQSNGKLGEFLGAGLSLAIMEGINIFSSGIRGGVAYLAATIPGIFQAGVSVLVDSGVLVLFEETFRAIGESLQAKIIGAAAALDPTGKLDGLAAAHQYAADSAFKNLPNLISNINVGAGLESGAQKVRDAMTAGTAAWEAASKEKIIDTSADMKSMEDIANALDSKSWTEVVTGETEKKKAIEDTRKQADGLAEALKTAGDAMDKSKKTTQKTIGGGLSAPIADARERAPIYKKVLGDARLITDGNSQAGDKDQGFGMRSRSNVVRRINESGAGSVERSRPAPRAATKEPTLDPLQKMLSKLDSIDNRLGALGLA